MAGLFDYMNPNNQTLVNQSAMVPPDQEQISSQGAPNYAGLDQALGGQANLKQNPVPGRALDSYMVPKDQQQEMLAGYRRAADNALANQTAGIEQYQNSLNQFAQKPTSFDFTPLAAYADSLNPGSKLLEGAKSLKGMSDEEKNQALLGGQKDIQKMKNDAAGTNLRALLDQINMLHQQNQEDLTRKHNDALEALANQKADGLMGRVQVQKDTQTQHVGDLFDKDPIIKTSKERLNQIQLDRHTLETSEMITPQILNEITGGIATALNGGKSAGLGQQEMQEIRNLQTRIANASQYMQNKPFNALSDENRKMLTDVLNRIEKGYGNSLSTRASELRDGRKFQYNEGANEALDNKAKEYTQFGKVYTPPGNAAQSSTAPKVGEVHDGYKFKGGDPSDQNSWEKQ